jgi:hypothetical protein
MNAITGYVLGIVDRFEHCHLGDASQRVPSLLPCLVSFVPSHHVPSCTAHSCILWRLTCAFSPARAQGSICEWV